MKHDYTCNPTVWHGKPLVFTWDDVTGAVTGPGAKQILLASQEVGLVGHPYPSFWEFDGGAGDGQHITSKRTLALIVGQEHSLPGDLAVFYPVAQADGFQDKSHTDADGTFVIGRDMIVN